MGRAWHGPALGQPWGQWGWGHGDGDTHKRGLDGSGTAGPGALKPIMGSLTTKQTHICFLLFFCLFL